MNGITEFSYRYVCCVLTLLMAYAKWAERNITRTRDLILFAMMPSMIGGVILFSLPDWLGKSIAILTLLPFAYFALFLFSSYMRAQFNERS